MDANGKTHHLNFGRLATPNLAVLTLARDVGSVILLSRVGDVYTQEGPAASPKLHQPAVCSASGLGYWRVGAQQPDIGSDSLAKRPISG